MDVKIEESWKKRLADEFEKDYFKQLTDFVKQEYRQGTVYPPGPYMFNAFEHCPFDKVKVVNLQYLLRMSMILCKYDSLTKFLTIINLNSIPHQYIQRNTR